MALTLRPAKASDIEAIVDLHIASRTVLMAFAPIVHPRHEMLEHFSAMLGSNRITVAQTTELLGYIIETPGWVHDLYVAPGAIGQGVGSALLEEAKRRQSRIDLWVFAENLRARRFYRRHDFVPVRGTRDENEERRPDVLLRWVRP